MTSQVLDTDHVVGFTRPSSPSVFTASDQKLELGKAWDPEAMYSVVLYKTSCILSVKSELLAYITSLLLNYNQVLLCCVHKQVGPLN